MYQLSISQTKTLGAPSMRTTRVAAALVRRTRRVVVNAGQMDQQVKEAIKEAKEACEADDAQECATAWDTVEELSAAAAKKDL